MRGLVGVSIVIGLGRAGTEQGLDYSIWSFLRWQKQVEPYPPPAHPNALPLPLLLLLLLPSRRCDRTWFNLFLSFVCFVLFFRVVSFDFVPFRFCFASQVPSDARIGFCNLILAAQAAAEVRRTATDSNDSNDSKQAARTC